MSRSDALTWLSTLVEAAADLPRERPVPPYWSQRGDGPAPPNSSLLAIVRRVRSLVSQFEKDGYFSETIGYDCVDGNGDAESSAEEELAQRVGNRIFGVLRPKSGTTRTSSTSLRSCMT
jgi:hypothetical protein